MFNYARINPKLRRLNKVANNLYQHRLFLNNQNPNFQVDAVVTWVDGDDPNWINTKNRYFNLTVIDKEDKPFHKKENVPERWKNFNELYYCLLSITHYLPWINNIFLVTMRPQKPNYIKLFPKVRIVHHDEIYPDLSYLPTFNSKSIESQLHNIPDLSEHFIYFNDDFFIGKLLPKSYFFSKDGKAQLYNRYGVTTAMRNVNEILKKSVNRSPSHVAYPMRKSDLKLAWKLFPEELERTARNRFRHSKDLWIIGLAFHLCHSQKTCERLIANPPDQMYLSFGTLQHLSNSKKKYFPEKYLEKYHESTPSLICFNMLDRNNPDHKLFFDMFTNIFMRKLHSFIVERSKKNV